MSRFVYKVYKNDEHIGDFSSINNILLNIEFEIEPRIRLIKAFKIPNFQKRIPQVYIDESIGLKVESRHLVYTGKILL